MPPVAPQLDLRRKRRQRRAQLFLGLIPGAGTGPVSDLRQTSQSAQLRLQNRSYPPREHTLLRPYFYYRGCKEAAIDRAINASPSLHNKRDLI